MLACVAGGIARGAGARNKFWRRSRSLRAAKPREISPARELGFLNAAHFYHVIDFN